MKRIFRYLIIFFSILLMITACSQEKDAVLNTTPLPSWNKGSVKAAILDFITEATDKNNPNYIAPADRIAVFDNDGTLWAEQPVYFQLQFVIDRIKAMAPEYPQWKSTQPFKAVL